ncbi:MAG: mechanosensitive ion channel domain-containing protein [bacterium]
MNNIMLRALVLGLFSSCMLLGASAHARDNNSSIETALAVERQAAQERFGAASKASEQLKTTLTSQLSTLETAINAARTDMDALQKQLLAALSKDDAPAIRLARARLAARQATLDADEEDRARLTKELEEAERERDAWKRRAATLELALRMDIKVLLATPAEIDDREKRVESAGKDIAAQAGQIQKYFARRSAAVIDLTAIRARIRGWQASDPKDPDMARASDEELATLRRQASQQEALIRLNLMLEQRARRGLSFARADYLISQRYAAALARRGHLQLARNAQTAAECAEGRLAALRDDLAQVQQGISSNLAAAVAQAEGATQSLAAAGTAADEAAARDAYAFAELRRQRWDTEAEVWKDFIALQKAGASFARELSDRARSKAERRTLDELGREERQLRQTLPTSEQYIRTLDVQIQKCDELVESARLLLGTDPAALADAARPLAALVGSFDATKPPSPSLVADILRSIPDRLSQGMAGTDPSAERRSETAALLASRLAQREMTRARRAISARWLDNSHAVLSDLDRTAGLMLWQQDDPRLNAVTLQEVVDLLKSLASNVEVTVSCWVNRIGNIPGVPSRRRAAAAAGGIILFWLAALLASRRIRSTTRRSILAGRLARTALPLLFTGFAVLWLAAGNMFLQWTGFTIIAAGLWRACRSVPLARDGQPLPSTSIIGAVADAVNTVLLWAVALLPLHIIAAQCENTLETRAVIERLWLFCVCLAVFRLVIHGSLAGRILSRRSAHRGLRLAGAATAWTCLVMAALVALIYLAGLGGLGRTVLHIAEATFAIVGVAVLLTSVAGWLVRRNTGTAEPTPILVRVIQGMVLMLAAVAVGWMWWLLLNRVVLASNAPPPVPELVQAISRALNDLSRAWQYPLSAGMTVGSLARGLLVFIASFWVSREAKAIFARRVLARTPMDKATSETFSAVLGYLIIVLGFLVGLNVAGSSLKNLTLLAGAVTVGVGFGLQNVINNFVSSLMIHFSRTIRVGDYIEVGASRGTVREIGLRNTVLTTDDDITVLVPNGSFISANIVNWTNPNRRTRLHVPVTVSRQADLAAVAELAAGVARANPMVLSTPAPVMEVRSLTPTHVTLDFLIWTEKPEKLAAIVGELGLSLDRVIRERGLAG